MNHDYTNVCVLYAQKKYKCVCCVLHVYRSSTTSFRCRSGAPYSPML